MGILAISVLVKNNKKIGLRLLDTETMTKKDVPYDSVYNVIKGRKCEVNNLEIRFGKLTGKTYSISKLSTVDLDKKKYKEGALLVIGYANNTYTIVDGLGRITKVKRLADNKRYVYELYINKAKEYKLIIKENERGITTCIGIEPENYDGTVLIENVDNVGYHNITDGKYNKFKCQAKKVIIGKGVKSIGEYAFYHNKYIEQLVIENRSHIKIGNGSFNDCSNLKEVAIYTNKQAELGPYSFENCNSLKEFYCSARTLGYYVCSGNKNLTKAKIEAVQLSSYSFNECSSLKELDLNVEDIHRFGETAITKLEINNESEIDACIFFDNSKLKEVRINSNRVTISGLMGNLGTRKNKRKDRLKIYIKGDASFINDYNCKYESVYESVKDAKIDIYMDSKCLGFEQLYKNLHGFYNKIESREDTTDAISLIDTSKNNKEQENRQKRVEGMLGKTYSQFLVEEFERAYNQEYNDNLRLDDGLKIGSMGIKIDDVPILKNTKTNNLGGGISLSFVESSSENATVIYMSL